jgi:hypothetical protein
VTFDDWLLSLHVLSGAAFIAGITVFWVVIFFARSNDLPDAAARLGPLAIIASAVLGVGATGTLVLGIWLALSYGNYDLFDGWVIAAIVLWVVAMAFGQRTGAAYQPSAKKAQELREAGQTGPSPELLALNRNSTGLIMQSLTSIVVLLILIDMIFKPGA